MGEPLRRGGMGGWEGELLQLSIRDICSAPGRATFLRLLCNTALGDIICVKGCEPGAWTPDLGAHPALRAGRRLHRSPSEYTFATLNQIHRQRSQGGRIRCVRHVTAREIPTFRSADLRSEKPASAHMLSTSHPHQQRR